MRKNDTQYGNVHYKDSAISTIEYIRFLTSVGAVVSDAGVVCWNENEYTLNVVTGLGPILQVGQEVYILMYNDTGAELANLTVMRPKAAALVGSIVLPTFEKAKADVFSTVEGTIVVTTMVIPNGEVGLVTRFGRARGGDTSSWGAGDALFVSATVAGELVNIKPEFPNYDISVGGVVAAATAPDGEIFVSVTRNIFDTSINFWNGVFRESIDFTVDSSGGVITGSLSPDNGHDDMTMMFSDGFTMLETTPPATVVLTAGTDAIPAHNYVYVPGSTKVLTVSTADWPTAEHIKVADIILRTAATTLTDGALGNRNWNDHIESTTSFQGHLSHITEKLRRLEAQWWSGCETTASLSGTPTDVYVANTSGVVYQLHKQTFPAYDMAAGDDMHVVNHFTTPYVTITNLNTQTDDSLGNTLANSSFSFVVWGVVNRSGQTSHLMLNLPSGVYPKNSPDLAVSDAFNYSNYNIPSDFQGLGFLLARFTFVLQAGGTTWSLYDTEDLRGKIPNTTAGGGGGGSGITTLLGLTDTPSAYSGFASLYALLVNAGETATEFVKVLRADGFAGGQTIYGGTASGDDLTLYSTSHATPGAIVIPDGQGLVFGTGFDGQIYSNGDDLYIRNATQDQDIYVQVNDGGVTTTVIFIDGSTARIGFGTINPAALVEMSGDSATNLFPIYETNENTAVLATVGLALRLTGTDDVISSACFIRGGKEQSWTSTASTRDGYLALFTRLNNSAGERVRITSDGNFGLATTDQFGSGAGVMGIANATTVPTSNPTGGGILYIQAGALKYRGSSGTITTVAPA